MNVAASNIDVSPEIKVADTLKCDDEESQEGRIQVKKTSLPKINDHQILV